MEKKIQNHSLALRGGHAATVIITMFDRIQANMKAETYPI